MIAKQVFAIILLLTSLIGCIGNTILLWIILSDSYFKKKASFIIIASLTWCDLLGALAYGLNYFIYSFMPNTISCSELCIIFGMLNEITFLSHSLHMFTLALNRCIVMGSSYNSKLRKLSTIKSVISLLIFIWSVSIFMRVWHQSVGGIVILPSLFACFVNYRNFIPVIFKVHLVWQYVNLTATVTFYIFIFVLLKRQRRRIEISNNLNSTTISKNPEIRTSCIPTVSIIESSSVYPENRDIGIANKGNVSNTRFRSNIRKHLERKKRERDIIHYALSLFGIYMFVTLSFTLTPQNVFPNIDYRIYSFLFSYFYCLIFASNSLLSFFYMSLFRQKIIELTKKLFDLNCFYL
ncbi:unnamed protein product [Gordionus sp. m RMFG-2023]